MWFFFLSWSMLRILPLEKCNNFYLLYLSCFTGYILVACSTHFSKDYYFYSSLFGWLSLCNCAACLKPYKCAIKSRWMLFHIKYLACSICDRAGSTRQFPFRLNYKICWNAFWYFNKIQIFMSQMIILKFKVGQFILNNKEVTYFHILYIEHTISNI